MSTLYQVTAGVAALRASPSDDSQQETQLLFGESFCVQREESGFGFGISAYDQYRGWVDMATLSAPVLIPTHTIKVLRTYVFSQPDLKSAPVCLLSINSKIAAASRHARFIKAQRLGWVVSEHLRPVGEAFASDWVEVAEHFIRTPYFWGGKESLGLDCSGLIQTSMEAAGLFIPRNTEDQYLYMHKHWQKIDVFDDFSGLKRGDLVFWPGHVGVMINSHSLLHANSHHMQTVCEPLARAARRIAFNHAPVRGIYRSPPVKTETKNGNDTSMR